MKDITKGTEKQISYATSLREEYLTKLREAANDSNALHRRIALVKIARIEDCDDAAILIDWIKYGRHMGENIVSIREQEDIRLGVEADREQFAQSNPRPEEPDDYTPSPLLRLHPRRRRCTTEQQPSSTEADTSTKTAAYEKATAYEKADQVWIEARDRYVRAHDDKVRKIIHRLGEDREAGR